MTNREKMLNLVLSDSNLIEYYDLKIEESISLSDALNSEYPIVVGIAIIIKGLSRTSKSSRFDEIYKEVTNYFISNLK